MLLYLGLEQFRVVEHLNTELPLHGTIYLMLLSLKTLKLKSIKTDVRDISYRKECPVNFNKNPNYR